MNDVSVRRTASVPTHARYGSASVRNVDPHQGRFANHPYTLVVRRRASTRYGPPTGDEPAHHASPPLRYGGSGLDGPRTAQQRTAPNMGTTGQPTNSVHVAPTQRKPLGRLIGAFKTVSTKRVNDLRSTPGTPLWQRNYHERVIRNNLSLRALRRYIASNPVLWQP